ncbi:MAG TPA: phosphotransferase [Bryobacteraceae bacterium]|nr:phosphotransferase [Bryobacteraceae bacterium]
MLELSAQNAAAYLETRGFGPPPTRIIELGGGVSNTVLLIETPARRFVLKQSLGKLRVEQDWFSDRGRIFRESGVLRGLAPLLPAGSLPEVLFEDRENCLFAMSAAPPEAQSWKSLLLAGQVDPEIAAVIGRMLGTLVYASWRSPDWEQAYGDQTVFDQLRLDPYYRSTALRHPELAPRFAALIEESGRRRVSLVHGDWSPKNFLVSPGSVMAIDFEVIHFGDPSFDSAFLLNHLLLKSFYRPEYRAALAAAAARFWTEFRAGLPADCAWIESATLAHLGGLLLARVDGKSPAEYLQDAALRERVRRFARRLFLDPPATVNQVFDSLCHSPSSV